MKNKTGLFVLHITGCVAFLSLPVLLSPDVAWDFHFTRLRPFQEDFISYTLLLLFFYLHYFFLVPRFYFKRRYVLYVVLIAASYAVIALLPHLVVPGNHMALPDENGPLREWTPGPRGPVFLSRTPRFEHLFQFMMVLVLSALIRINNRLKQTEKAKVSAELSYLKAQINPHFLFNTLNSIYSSAIEESADNTASAVVKLAGMMRYVISESHQQYVPLAKELSYISDYIELQRIRLGDTVHLNYAVSGDAAGKQVAPLILISFIENAFKHGVNPGQNSSIDIAIRITGHILQLSVLNNKVETVNSNDAKNNIGVENTSSRLKLLYPARHELAITEDEKEYRVSLKIDLHD